jgi:hypothetical protein
VTAPLDASTPIRAWPAPARALAAACVATSRSSVPLLALAFAWDTTIPERVIVAVLVALGVLPAAAAWLLARAYAAEGALDPEALRIRGRDVSIEIPRASIARVAAWRIPLPGAGVALRLASGARAPVGLEPPLAALVAAFGVAHPNLAFAAARRAAPLAGLRHPLVRFGLFGLVPTAALFHAHQMIAWGAPLGQYYAEGLGPWLASLGVTWLSTLVGIALYASVVRAAVEVPAFAATWIAPRRATFFRGAAEWIAAIAYYGGVPAFLAIRFLA